MKAWVCRRFAKPFEIAIEEVPKPVPGPREVLVRVAAVGLAFGETMVLEGTYQKLPPFPYIPCSEFAGVVETCGDGVSRFQVGDRVMAFSVELAGGGLAEFCALSERYVFRCPDQVALVDAAGCIMNYWTAFNALIRRGGLRDGETLVVHGATGGVGSAAVEVGRAVGATTIATGSDDARLAAVAADHVVNHRAEPLRERLLQLTGGRGADVYFDPVGGDLFDTSMRAIATGGRILVVGFTSGRAATARTNVLLVKMISVIGVEGRLAIERTGGQGWSDFGEMLDWVETGRLVPRTREIFAFENALDGFKRILTRQQHGKCVVLVSAIEA